MSQMSLQNAAAHSRAPGDRRTPRLALIAALAGCPLLLAAAGAGPVARGGDAGPQFAPTGERYNVCCYTVSMAAADVNGDGLPDLIAGNGLSYDVGVLLNDGAGGYAEPISLPVSIPEMGHVAVAVGDVDGDGDADIVASGYHATDIGLYLGDGNGGFGAAVPFSSGAGSWPRDIALADVTGDGDLDIVTVNNDTANVSVLAGNGSGGFAAARVFPTGAFPVELAVADVTGDGDLDVVTANAGSRDVSVLAGNGSGGFAAPVTLAIGVDAEPFGLAVGDATGDGHLDIVTANPGSDGSPFPPPELAGSVSVLAGNGSGSFAAAAVHTLSADNGRAHGVAIGDITGDGEPDIVASRPVGNRISVLAGDGSGGFAAAIDRPASVGPTPVVIVDTDADGALDIVAADAVSPSVSILPGDGEGGIGFDGNHEVGLYPHSVAAGDFDGDGDADIASADIQSNTVSVLINDGAGGFAAAVSHAVGNSPATIVAGDIDGDGNLDLATANLGDSNVSILLGDGTGGFAAAANFSVSPGFQSPYALALGDANGDGDLDIATANTNIANEGISLLIGNGDGTFAAPVELPVGSGSFYGPQGITFTDVTGDGHDDIVTSNINSSDVSVLAGDGAGNFAPAVHFPAEPSPVMVQAGDVTGDGRVDLVTLNHAAQTVSVLAGNGSGGFAPAASFHIYPDQVIDEYKPWPWGLVLADVTGDGKLDIVTANTQNDSVSVLPNDGSGGFGDFYTFGTGAHPGAAAVADIDGDGRADIVTANRQTNNVSVLLNVSEVTDLIFADGFEQEN